MSGVRMRCPCCGTEVEAPTLEMVVESRGISEDQAVVLGAIWRGKGSSVATSRIFDAMYADDPNGGPSESRMYSALRMRLFKLRQKLEGSGIGIAFAAPRGYRLTIGKGVE